MIRANKQSIPTLRAGIERFLQREETAGKKDMGNTRSVLLGSQRRVVGKTAAGSAFAQSEFGAVRMDRLEAHHFTKMFNLREPESLAPATRKRGMSTMASFIEYGIKEQWLHDHVRAAIVSGMPDSAPVDEWLYPEQVDAITKLVESSDAFDDYDRFAYDTGLALGTRPAETVTLKRSFFDPRTMQVNVVGKGRGLGKKRAVPVDDAFAERWEQHARRHEIKRDGFMFYQRKFLVTGGSSHDLGLVVDKSQPTTAKALRSLYTKIQQRCDEELAQALQPTFKLVPKAMRRTYACTQLILHRLNLGGLDLRSLQKALGHSSLDTTQTYLADVHAYLNLVEQPVNTCDGVKLILQYRNGS
jgi:site-specific recombinase XerD